LSVSGDHRYDCVEGALERHRQALNAGRDKVPLLRCADQSLEGRGPDDCCAVSMGSISQRDTHGSLILLT
jgi:hypothetical protein